MYSVVEVPPEAPDALESVGSKRKFWYTQSTGDAEEDWLFKAARQDTGEDWAEKVAAELCALIDLPHAKYTLATWTEERNDESKEWDGVVTPRIQDEQERLMLGNELLAGQINRYPSVEGNRFYKNPKYTLRLTLSVLEDEGLGIQLSSDWSLANDISTVPGAFLGFLLLDAWIGNTDRHDNNWGIIERSGTEGPTRVLAPTFDHASSLGRELQDEERRGRLTTNDENYTVKAYLDRCRSAFVSEEGAKETIHPITAFQRVAKRYPDAAAVWLRRLETVSNPAMEELFDRIPEGRISDVSVEFALRQLQLNRNALLDLDF